LHAVLVVVAGAATGGIVGCKGWGVGVCAAGGALCAMAFVPVCMAVVATARRAQRGRLGSLVADTDRRAVWGILALALAVTTLEALPDWPASTLHEAATPYLVIGALMAVGAVTLAILRRDRLALLRAREAIEAGLSVPDATEVKPEDDPLPVLDLGLGDEVLAQVQRGAAAYRQRERTLALVQGDAESALQALRRAVRRGELGLGLVVTVAVTHAAALSPPALVAYEALRCNDWRFAAYRVGAKLSPNPDLAVARRRAALDGAWSRARTP
jgi:hypothetical protein